MLIQRLAKGFAVVAVLSLQTLHLEIRYLSILTILLAVAMIFCSIYAGRIFRQKVNRLENSERNPG
jgi:hypothetical protein